MGRKKGIRWPGGEIILMTAPDTSKEGQICFSVFANKNSPIRGNGQSSGKGIASDTQQQSNYAIFRVSAQIFLQKILPLNKEEPCVKLHIRPEQKPSPSSWLLAEEATEKLPEIEVGLGHCNYHMTKEELRQILGLTVYAARSGREYYEIEYKRAVARDGSKTTLWCPELVYANCELSAPAEGSCTVCTFSYADLADQYELQGPKYPYRFPRKEDIPPKTFVCKGREEEPHGKLWLVDDFRKPFAVGEEEKYLYYVIDYRLADDYAREEFPIWKPPY